MTEPRQQNLRLPCPLATQSQFTHNGGQIAYKMLQDGAASAIQISLHLIPEPLFDALSLKITDYSYHEINSPMYCGSILALHPSAASRCAHPLRTAFGRPVGSI